MTMTVQISLKTAFHSFGCMSRSGISGLGRHFYPHFMNEETEVLGSPVTCPASQGQKATEPVSVSTPY